MDSSVVLEEVDRIKLNLQFRGMHYHLKYKKSRSSARSAFFSKDKNVQGLLCKQIRMTEFDQSNHSNWLFVVHHYF